MAARNRSHIFVDQVVSSEPYTPVGSGRDGGARPSPADPAAHAAKLRDALSRSIDTPPQEVPSNIDIAGSIDGVFVQFESDPTIELALTSLDPQSGKNMPELRAVSERQTASGPVQIATVFIPDGSVGFFLDRFEQYATELTPSGGRKNANLVERIADIRRATLEALWTDPRSTFPDENELIWWEVWLRKREGTIERLASFVAQADARLAPRQLVLDDRVVAQVYATADRLASALEVLDDIAELRRPAEAFAFLADVDTADQAAFVADLADRLEPPSPSASRTCLLDSGVAAGHPLIGKALDPADVHTVDPGWTVEDRLGHGTAMAGLALYDDVGQALVSGGPVPLGARLESVKILPDSGHNEEGLYGAITAQAASLVEIEHPEAARTFVLAVTASSVHAGSETTFGQPTTWSSTIDALAAGRQITDTADGLIYLDSPEDRSPRLFVLSAGNVRRPFDADHLDRSDLEPAEDPAQAWNALVVGAYTDLADTSNEPPFTGWTPLASRGDLSPFSRTSVGYKREWRHAPDVVLEGGNAAHSPAGDAIDTPPHLQILTTRSPSLGGRLLTTATGTSPATASAAHLISRIRERYPSLWPETLRALVVHSARWTPAMITSGNKAEHRTTVRRYGWGVPDADRALRSADDAVTLISEQVIKPFEKGKMREIHFHDLPWPTTVLLELGDAPVEMRVALSYFIEPNPSRRGWKRRYSYASHGLRFEVRRPTETNAAFRKRLNKLALEEDEKRPRSAEEAGEWFLGPTERVRGSLHVDHWYGTAADLAARESIAVYPVTGWWKEQPKRDRSELGVRYSLVISIETPETDVDIWTPVATQASVPIAIEI